MAVVLLVEDEEQVRVLAESYLVEQGHQVLSAGTGEGAIAVLEKNPKIDVLFVDIDLKGEIASGIEVARKTVESWPHVKVLYTTGRDLTDGMKARFQEFGVLAEALHGGRVTDCAVRSFQNHPATAPLTG
jgi:CheY-like chemotaxis protein